MTTGPSKPTTPAISASSALAKLKTRDALREFILREIPGWDNWLTIRAALIQTHCQNEVLLRSESDILAEIGQHVHEIADLLGERVDRLFLPYAQLRPDFDPESNRAATEPLQPLSPAHRAQRGALGPPPTWDDLVRSLATQGVRPSLTLVNLLGALAVVRKRRRSGRPKNVRLDLALEYVARELAPYAPAPLGPDAAQTPSTVARLNSNEDDCAESTSVRPPADIEDVLDFDAAGFRREPVSLRFCALVALYLSLPGRQDPEYDDADPTRHGLAVGVLKDAEKALRARIAALHSDE